MKNAKPQKSRRPALTKPMLLPLPTPQVRALSLETHMALALLRSGTGSFDQMLCLLRAVYMAFFLRGQREPDADLDLYRRADDALAECNARVERGEPWRLLDDEAAAVERVLIAYDAQLAAASKYRYRQAWERLHRFAANNAPSPFSVEESMT